jgi:magnesium transporter
VLHVYVNEDGRLAWARGAEIDNAPLPETSAWLDLVDPSPDEIRRVEALIGISLPTREQMAEIEDSSRLRQLPGALHLTVMALIWADTDAPRIIPVSFLLAGGRLVTIHHIDPQPFLAFRRKVGRVGLPSAQAELVMSGLVEAMVERTAGVLRRVALELDAVSARSFRKRSLRERGVADDDNRTLRRIGQAGYLIGKAHVSLSGQRRMLEFLSRGEGPTLVREFRAWARGAILDLRGLDEYALFLTQKVDLLLSGALGQINAEQNEIVKIVSVLSVALFPPTLVASLYGMNFKHMPELHWQHGYLVALALMIFSAIGPMWWFKRKGWL